MDFDANSDNPMSDILSDALSASGLASLADEFGDEDDGSFDFSFAAEPQAAPQEVVVGPSSHVVTASPATQIITVNTAPGAQSMLAPPTQLATPTGQAVRIIGGGKHPPGTKVIHVHTGGTNSSLLHRSASGPVLGTTPNGNRIIQHVVTSNNLATPNKIIVSQTPNIRGAMPTGIRVGAQGSSVVTLSRGVTPQSIRGVVPQSVGNNTVARKVVVAAPNGKLNGNYLMTTTASGAQVLHGIHGQGQAQFIISKNGQLIRVTPTTIATTNPGSVNTINRLPVATSVRTVTVPGTVVQSSSAVRQLQTIAKSVSAAAAVASSNPVQIINRPALSGAKVIATLPAAPSPKPSLTSVLHHSASMPVISGVTDSQPGSRSESPVFGMGNIPTVVSNKICLNNIGSMGSRSLVSLSSGSTTTASVIGVNGNSVMVRQTNKDMIRSWHPEDIQASASRQLSMFGPSYRTRAPVMEEEEVEEESEELGHAETYNEYMPTKLKIGIRHPDPVVETSSLASVEPPDTHYQLNLPEVVIDSGFLSALQLESITYACQRHCTILPSGERAGYLIGDGAGVGKGRTIAGIIYENYIQGRKRALWLSVSNDLKVDAQRDLGDIGARIEVHPLNKQKYAKLQGKENNVKKGVVFATYSSLIGESQSNVKYRTRLKQLLKWCGKDFDGVIVFDECHKAKNLCPTGSSKPTKTGLTVLELQNRLPKARVVYASATGASEPKNMAYMTRLGLWGLGTPFKEFNDFIGAVEKRGVGAMELVAMDMKLRGMYIARQLSFKGVTFRIEEIMLEPTFKKMYDDSAMLWMEARGMFQKAADLIDPGGNTGRKNMWGQFWSAHQRFFKYLCISAKVHHCVMLTREAIKAGKCIVIGLQSTGEARTMELVEQEGTDLNDFVSTAKGVFQTLVEKHFPTTKGGWGEFLGLNSILSSENSRDSFFGDSNLKRKREDLFGGNKKRQKVDESSDSEMDSDSEISLSSSDLSLSSESDSDEDEDTNPFGRNSDSDDDPWVVKKKPKKSKAPKKKKEKEKKKKKKKKKTGVTEEDEFCDRALERMSHLNKLTKSGSLAGQGTNGSNTTTKAGINGAEQSLTMKTELLNLIEQLGDRLPPNTLDQLIDELGGPDNVAEMTGRKGRVVQNHEGIQYESRSESDVNLENINLAEKERFMNGEKDVAIISEAASSGISLQADRRANNQKRRVHITLELPWSADRAIQQFGRTHRSNQVSAPEYVFLISELAGERRFASTVAKRLECLGALTHGDRRATESRDLSRFNIDNKYGRSALDNVMKSVVGMENPMCRPPKTYKGEFFEDIKRPLEGVGMISIDHISGLCSLDKDYQNISKFLNRLLGMPVDLQNTLFDFFNSTLTATILDAKRCGKWDMGILDLGSGEERVKKIETRVFVGNTATNTAKTELTTVQVERGMPWAKAMDIWRKCQTMEEGFYMTLQERSGKRTVIMVVHQGKNKKKEKIYSVYKPNLGLQSRPETLEEIKKKCKKVLPDEAQPRWEDQYYASASQCSHIYWYGHCKKRNGGLDSTCEIGLRTRQYHVLSGSVLSVWSRVENVMSGTHLSFAKMQIMRLRTEDGQRIVGSLIPPSCVPALVNELSQDCARTYTEQHQHSIQSAINGLYSSSSSLPSPALPRSNGVANTPGSSGSTFTDLVQSTSASSDSNSQQSAAAPREPLLSMPSFDLL